MMVPTMDAYKENVRQYGSRLTDNVLGQLPLDQSLYADCTPYKRALDSLPRFAPMFERNQVVNMVRKVSIVLMQQAVLAASLCSLYDQSA